MTENNQTDQNTKYTNSYEHLDIDTLKLLHKHTYERIMWYRNGESPLPSGLASGHF